MSSIKQYISIYDNHREVIDAHSPELLRRWHAEARRVVEGAELPDTHTDGYELTSIDELMAPDLGVNINRMNFRADVASAFRCDIPNMSTMLGVVVNDVFHPTQTLANNLPAGVVFDSLSHIMASDNEAVKKAVSTLYGSVAPLDSIPVALNTMLAQDAVVLYVPRGVEVAKPLQLVNIFASPTPLCAFRRILVILEEGAQARLLTCDHTQRSELRNPDATYYIASQVVEVVMGADSSFDLYDMEKSDPATSRHCLTYVMQHRGSNLVTNTTTLTCGTTRNDIVVSLRGEHCETLLTGMAIASGRQHVDCDTEVRHLAPRCKSNQLFKYVLDDNARGAFEGTIVVSPEAPFTEAYQTNRNIVASTEARMHTQPQLLIYNDEVKCSHGATVGQIDEKALFYMRTRGIPEAEARNMLMQAFMVDVIDSVRLLSLRDRLRHLVEKRFCTTDNANCDNCSLS